jgi:hypothetical protein
MGLSVEMMPQPRRFCTKREAQPTRFRSGGRAVAMTLCDAACPFILGALMLAGCSCPPRRELDETKPPPARSAAKAEPVEPRAVRVRVRDSGIDADDAFTLEVDGAGHGETPVGGERTFSLWLSPGEHSLRLRGAGAPDGQGTYALELDGPVKVIEGPPLEGHGLNKGMTRTWKVRVE